MLSTWSKEAVRTPSNDLSAVCFTIQCHQSPEIRRQALDPVFGVIMHLLLVTNVALASLSTFIPRGALKYQHNRPHHSIPTASLTEPHTTVRLFSPPLPAYAFSNETWYNASTSRNPTSISGRALPRPASAYGETDSGMTISRASTRQPALGGMTLASTQGMRNPRHPRERSPGFKMKSMVAWNEDIVSGMRDHCNVTRSSL
jgi:hypothetical protein